MNLWKWDPEWELESKRRSKRGCEASCKGAGAAELLAWCGKHSLWWSQIWTAEGARSDSPTSMPSVLTVLLTRLDRPGWCARWWVGREDSASSLAHCQIRFYQKDLFPGMSPCDRNLTCSTRTLGSYRVLRFPAGSAPLAWCCPGPQEPRVEAGAQHNQLLAQSKSRRCWNSAVESVPYLWPEHTARCYWLVRKCAFWEAAERNGNWELRLLPLLNRFYRKCQISDLEMWLSKTFSCP